MSKKVKTRLIITSAISVPLSSVPSNPPNPWITGAAKKAAQVAASALLTGSSANATALGGHIIPHFHQKLLSEGTVPASIYVLEVITGKIPSKSSLYYASVSLNRTFSSFLTPNQKKLAIKELEKIHAPEHVEAIKNTIGLRGGDKDINWINIYTQIYFWYIVWCFFVIFVPNFLQNLDTEIRNNPYLVQEFSDWYDKNISPKKITPNLGFTINKQNCLLACPFLIDDIFLLNL